MSLQEYITPSDVRNKTFKAFSPDTQLIYTDMANNELEDVAKRLGVVDLADIVTPIHFKLREYLIHYAVQQLALDNANFNNKDGRTQGDDKYDVLFQRESYVLQDLHNRLALIMFTGGAETPTNRATSSQRLERA